MKPEKQIMILQAQLQLAAQANATLTEKCVDLQLELNALKAALEKKEETPAK